MKYLLSTLISFTILSAQTQKDYPDYFPMHIGDIWTYQLIEYDYFNDNTLDTSYLTCKITGDTTIQDGFKYFTFTHDGKYNYKSFK